VEKKRDYKAPKVRTEVIKVGVFGSYGGTGGTGDDDDENTWSPVNFLAPMFGWCCS
jgi:hypothetical protein